MHSKLGWSAWYVCIGRLPQRKLERKYRGWGLCAFLARLGVVYIQHELGNLAPEKLELWCGAFTNGCAVQDVVALNVSFDCTTLSRAGACNNTEVRTAGGGAVSLAAQYDSQHVKQLCTTLHYVCATVPAALISVENLWSGHFKEHQLVQEMIEGKVFYLYCTDFCAAVTEALDRAVTVTATGGGVFSQKLPVLLLVGVDPKEPIPICQKASCRMVILNTSSHAWVIQSKSKQTMDPKGAFEGSDSTTTGREASSSSTSVGLASKKGKLCCS